MEDILEIKDSVQKLRNTFLWGVAWGREAAKNELLGTIIKTLDHHVFYLAISL